MRGLGRKASILIALSLGACLWTLDEERIEAANSDGAAPEGGKSPDSARGGAAGTSDASSGTGGQTGSGGSGKGGSSGANGSSGASGSGGATGGSAGSGGSSGSNAGSGGSKGGSAGGTSGAGGSADSGPVTWHCTDSAGGCTCTKSGTGGQPTCTVDRTCCYVFVFSGSDACQCANDTATNCAAKAKAVNGSVVPKCPP